jgi:hypothetical protein
MNIECSNCEFACACEVYHPHLQKGINPEQLMNELKNIRTELANIKRTLFRPRAKKFVEIMQTCGTTPTDTTLSPKESRKKLFGERK